MKSRTLLLVLTIVNSLFFVSCNSNNSSVKKEEKPILYADARLDMIQTIKDLNSLINTKIETLKKTSKQKIPEKDKLILSLETINGYLQKKHSDIDKTIKAVEYIKKYSKNFHKEIIPIEQIKKIEEIIYMMSTYPTYG